jgi:hypothetical protein
MEYLLHLTQILQTKLKLFFRWGKRSTRKQLDYNSHGAMERNVRTKEQVHTAFARRTFLLLRAFQIDYLSFATAATLCLSVRVAIHDQNSN